MNKIIEINEKTYVVDFLEKDTDAEFVKWHNFIMTNMHNANDFYVVQIVQVRGCEPHFYVEYFEIDSNGYYLGEWVYIDEYFTKEDADKLKILLIELSDAELHGEFEEEKVYGRDRLGRR